MRPLAIDLLDCIGSGESNGNILCSHALAPSAQSAAWQRVFEHDQRVVAQVHGVRVLTRPLRASSEARLSPVRPG